MIPTANANVGGCFLATLRARDGAAAIAGVINGILWGEVVGDCDATTFFVRANHVTKAFPHKTHVA
jgi:hypothetical protein